MAASDILFADVSKLLFSDVREIVRLAGREAGETTDDAWLAGIDGAPAAKIASELTGRLAEALAQQHTAQERLLRLVGCATAAAPALAAIEAATETASLPLSPQAVQDALAADTLLKALANGYATLAFSLQSAATTTDPAAVRETLRLAALHAMQTLARRELLAWRGQAVPSPASWKLGQDVHATARAAGVADANDAPPSEAAALTITAAHAATLLFALADPSRLPRNTLAAVQAFVCDLAGAARIEAAATPVGERNGRFLIGVTRAGNAKGSRPARPLDEIDRDKPLPANALILDCTALLPQLDRLLADGADAPLPSATLRLLRQAWGGAATEPASPPPARRFTRTRFKQHIDVITGLPAIVHLLSGRSPGRRQTDATHAAENDISEWLIVNESPDGFAIQHLKGAAPALAIGDIVMLRPKDDSKTFICLVRRTGQGSPEHPETGVQLLGANATVVPLPAEDILAMGQMGLLLKSLPAFDNAAGLVSAAGALNPQSVITDNEDGTLKYYRIGTRIASGAAIEFHLLQGI